MLIKTVCSNLAVLTLVSLFLCSCGGSQPDSNQGEQSSQPAVEEKAAAPLDPMQDVGIGPIKSLTLPETIDQEMVKTGEAIFVAKCSACHKVEKTFIGPSPKGVLDRRNPAWVMNMMLNPIEMVQKNDLAKQLMIESNMAMMADQNLTEEDARAILEYFRTL